MAKVATPKNAANTNASKSVSTKGIDEKVIAAATPAVDPMAHTFKLSEIHKPEDDASASNKAIDAAIQSLYASGKQVRITAHVTGCSIILHYVKHGDYTKLMALKNAISKVFSNAQGNNFVMWVCRYSNLKWREETKTKDRTIPAGFYADKKADRFFRLEDEKIEGAEDMPGALNNPFWDLDKPAGPVRVFDLDKYLTDMIKKIHTELARKEKAEKAKDRKTVNAVHLTPEQVNKVDDFARSMGVDVAKVLEK